MAEEEKIKFENKENQRFSGPRISDKYGDFQEIKEQGEETQTAGEAESVGHIRIRMPRRNELIGMIIQRFGGNRMEVKCTDGNIRNSRVPGRYRRRLWLRPNDIVIVVPWETDDSKADIIFKYSSTGINQLRKKGILDSLREGF